MLEKYNEIWDKVSHIIEKAFHAQLIFEEKYLKNKLKYYNGKSNTYFFSKKVLRGNVNCACVVLTVLDSICRIKKELLRLNIRRAVTIQKKLREIVSFIPEESSFSSDDDGDNDDDESIEEDSK